MSKLLIVDDIEENLHLLDLLFRHKYDVYKAQNGVEALEILKTINPIGIISDILMPKMDGFSLILACKKDEILKNIPFIFYTSTYISSEDEKFAYELGADLFLRKPLDVDQLEEQIEEAILKNQFQKPLIKLTEAQLLQNYNKTLEKKLIKKIHRLELIAKELNHLKFEHKVEKENANKINTALQELKNNFNSLLSKSKSEFLKTLDAEKDKNLVKNKFFKTLSHDLRTNLNSILGFSLILKNELSGELTADQKKQLSIVNKNAKYLLNLVKNSLELAKTKNGELIISKKKFNYTTLLKNCIAGLKPVAFAKNIEIEIICANHDIVIKNDKLRVQQILLNLLSNALKYTEKGKVSIECYVDGTTLITKIKDTGIGIKQEDLELIFNPFKRIQLENEKHFDGFGLGLHISQYFAQKINGNISVASTYGLGSLFIFTLSLNNDEYENLNHRRQSK